MKRVLGLTIRSKPVSVRRLQGKDRKKNGRGGMQSNRGQLGSRQRNFVKTSVLSISVCGFFPGPFSGSISPNIGKAGKASCAKLIIIRVKGIKDNIVYREISHVYYSMLKRGTWNTCITVRQIEEKLKKKKCIKLTRTSSLFLNSGIIYILHFYRMQYTLTDKIIQRNLWEGENRGKNKSSNQRELQIW